MKAALLWIVDRRPSMIYGPACNGLRGRFIGRPEARPVWIFIGHQPPERASRDTPKPAVAALGLSIGRGTYLFGNAACDLAFHPGQEAIPLTQ